MSEHSFFCIDHKASPNKLIPPHPYLPEEYIGRSIAVIDMRRRILPIHVPDLTGIQSPDVEDLLLRMRNEFGSGIGVEEADPLSLLNWVVGIKLPWYFGFHSVLDLLHSDFLIIEALARCKTALGVETLRNRKVFPAIEEIHSIVGAKDCIDYSVESGIFDLTHAIYRLRSSFDKLAVAIGYAFHLEEEIKNKGSYNSKIDVIKNASYIHALTLNGKNDLLLTFLSSIDEIKDLKDLRDKEAHLGSLSIKHGFRGEDGYHDIVDVVETVFSFLDKFRLALLNFLIFLPSLSEGGIFPENVICILTDKGLFILNLETNGVYMSFILGKKNVLSKLPTRFEEEPSDGIFKICCKDNSVITINFPEDICTKITRDGEVMKYNGDIKNRNSGCGYI